MADTFNIAVVGAGLMGKRHVEAIQSLANMRVAAIVDPSEAAETYAKSAGASWHADISDMIQAVRPDGIVLATPNRLHVDHGLQCIEARIPVLVEKPIAADVQSAATLVEAAEDRNAKLLVGHHRRHNPIIQAAKRVIDDGRIGRIIAAQAMCWLIKPDDYFDAAWRREPGAGPIFINLIHDLDLLRYLCGEIVSVFALESNIARGNAVEDTAAIALQFQNGALGTITLSDSVVAPWSWEMTAGENPAYPQTDEACYLIGGTHGAIEVPGLRLWRQPQGRGWWEPITSETIDVAPVDPITAQLRHFHAVAMGAEEPLVSGREGLRSLAVVEAIKRSAASKPPGEPQAVLAT